MASMGMIVVDGEQESCGWLSLDVVHREILDTLLPDQILHF